jgi:predicted PurR-regulated permease PerM
VRSIASTVPVAISSSFSLAPAGARSSGREFNRGRVDIAARRPIFSGVSATTPAADDDDRLTPAALYRAVLLSFVLVLVVLLFPTLASVLLLVLLVVLVAIPMSAAADALERLRIPRAVAAPLTLLAMVAVAGAAIALLVPIFSSEGRRLLHSLPSLFDQVRQQFGQRAGGTSGESFRGYVSGYSSHPQRLLRPAATLGAGIAGAATSLIIVAITALYTSIWPEPLQRGLLRLVPPPGRDRARRVMQRLGDAYLGWMRGLVVGMVVLWVIAYVGLRLVDLPFALVFATITALAMIVPYYGALVTSIPPILLAVTISPTTAVVVAAIYLVAHQVEGHLIEPLVMARAVKLHPALVAIGVVAVERLFGPIGLIVAVPVLVTVKVLVEELWVRPQEASHGLAEAADGDDSPEPPRRFRRASAAESAAGATSRRT